MNEIERILHKYFSDKELEYMSLSGRIDDPAWMERQGYAKMVKYCFSVSRELTPEGKRFVKESEKRIDELSNELMNHRATPEDRESAMNEIYLFLANNPDYDIEKELPESLYYTYLSLLQG